MALVFEFKAHERDEKHECLVQTKKNFTYRALHREGLSHAPCVNEDFSGWDLSSSLNLAACKVFVRSIYVLPGNLAC